MVFEYFIVNSHSHQLVNLSHSINRLCPLVHTPHVSVLGALDQRSRGTAITLLQDGRLIVLFLKSGSNLAQGSAQDNHISYRTRCHPP